MAQIDVVDGLASDHEEHKAEEEDCTASVSEISPLVVDIGHRENIKLREASTSCSVDREENWPCNETADKAHYDGELEEAQEQEAIKSVMIENPCVRNGVELRDPAEERVGEIWGALVRPQTAHKRSWSVAILRDGQLATQR